MKAIVLILLLTTSMARAEVIRTECQTDESRKWRDVSKSEYRAARENNPWFGCGGVCQRPTAFVEGQTAKMNQHASDARTALLRARSLEAAQCPRLADAILNVGPVTETEKLAVAAEFNRLMQFNRSRFEEQKRLRKGSLDDITASDPDKNDLIPRLACAEALRNFDLGEGWFADPKLCAAPLISG